MNRNRHKDRAMTAFPESSRIETRQQVRREGIELTKRLRARQRAEQRTARQRARPRKTEGSDAFWEKLKTAIGRMRRTPGSREDSRRVAKRTPYGRILRTSLEGGREVQIHATKGRRSRRA